MIGSRQRWGMMAKNVPERPDLVGYTRWLGGRPPLKRTTQKDNEILVAQAG